MRSYVICAQKQERKVALDVCLTGCQNMKSCVEFSLVPREQVLEAMKRLKIPLETVVDVEIIPSDPDLEKVEAPADPGEREAFPVTAKENPQTEAQQLYTQALKLKEEIETKWYDLGRVLEILFEKKYYLDYAPNWKEFCRTSFDFEWRYADYLRVTSRKCDEVGIDPGEAAKIGIAKMKEVVPIITRSNKNHWLSEARKCTTAGLNAKVRLARGRITKDEAARVPIKVFIPLYEAQKEVWDRAFELAGKILGSDKKGVQAEMIAAEFLSTYEQPDKEWPRARIAAAWLTMLERVQSDLRIKFNIEVIDLDTGEIISKTA